MATYPWLDVGWKEDSFLSWFSTSGVSFKSDGNVVTVNMTDALYGEIYTKIHTDVSKYKYLITRYKVERRRR